jgi:uncharacterized protein YbjT (DUF2867 family)
MMHANSWMSLCLRWRNKMNILVTGFNGKVGVEVANKLKEKGIPMKCAVRDIEKAKLIYGDTYDFITLDFSDPSTFAPALYQIDKIFLNYPPGDKMEFERFFHMAKEQGIQHIVYLSVKMFNSYLLSIILKMKSCLKG